MPCGGRKTSSRILPIVQIIFQVCLLDHGIYSEISEISIGLDFCSRSSLLHLDPYDIYHSFHFQSYVRISDSIKANLPIFDKSLQPSRAAKADLFDVKR